MKYITQTDIGYVRDENQDRVETRELGDNLLICLCDGMGGERSGGMASSMAIEVFFERFEEGYVDGMDAYGMRSLLLSSVSAANTIVYTSARMDYQHFGMGTTCVAAYLCADYIAIANVGDSRAYLLQDGKMRQITWDHSFANELCKKGKITEEQAKVHPQRHMLVRAVGVEKTVDPDYFQIDLGENEKYRLLMCSDGLCSFCEDDKIVPILSQDMPIEIIVQELIGAALENGGRDNVSVAIVDAQYDGIKDNDDVKDDGE